MSLAAPPPAPASLRSAELLGPFARPAKRPLWRQRRSWVAAGALAVFALAYWSIGRKPAGNGSVIETFTVAKRTFPVTLTEKGELEAQKSVDLKCEVEGRSTIIWIIPEGTEVKEGDLLVKLASNQIDDLVQAEKIKLQNADAAFKEADSALKIQRDQGASDIRKAELAVRTAEIDLEKYVKGDYEVQIKDKKLTVERAQKLLEQAESVLADSRELLEKKFITPREFEQDEFSAYEKRIEVEKAQIALETFVTYTDRQERQKREEALTEAQKDWARTQKQVDAKTEQQEASWSARQAELGLTKDRLAKLEEQQRKTEIHAPAAGLVVYDPGDRRWGGDRSIAEGAEVYERQTIIKLPDTSLMQVKLRIHESKTSRIAVGQPATVEVEGRPGERFTGKVSRIAPLADSRGSWLNPDLKEYDTVIALDQTDATIKPGTTARAVILAETIENVIAVPVQAVYSVGQRSFIFRGADTHNAAPVAVTVGASSDEYIEIKEGLAEGDVILLAANDALRAKLPSEPAAGDKSAAPAPGGKTVAKGSAPAKPSATAQPAAAQPAERPQ
jgi:HlyD family secretion protein